MRPVAEADGHDAPGLVDELCPSLAAAVDDVLIGGEHPVRQPVVAQELPDVLDRVQLGERGGSGSRVTLAGMTRLAAPCQPAWSSSTTAWQPGSTARLISAMCSLIAAVSHFGLTSPAPFPILVQRLAGQIAPKMVAEAVRWSCGARGLVPRRAPSCPAPRDVVLLADPGLVPSLRSGQALPPQLYGGAGRQRGGDRLKAGGEAFLKCSIAPSSCA